MGRLQSLGAGLAALLLAAPSAGQNLVRDAEIEDMVRDFSVPFYKAAGLNPDAVRNFLIADRSLNAFVTQGQNIFLHTGTIVEAETPMELKGVLAHETGHIKNGDLVKQGDAARAAMGPALLAMAAGIIAAAAGEGQAGAAIFGSAEQFAYLDYAAFSRGVEATADQTGLQLLEATGQSGEGLASFFERFRSQEVFSYSCPYGVSYCANSRYSRVSPYFRTHPLSSERIESLREGIAKQEHRDARDSPEDQRRLDLAKAKIYGYMEAPRDTFAKYPPSDDSTPAYYARAMAHYRAATFPKAIADMDVIIGREPDNSFFHELKGQILYEAQRYSESIAAFRRSVELAPNEPLLRIGLAQSLIETEDPADLKQALVELELALAREPDNSWAWYQKSRVHQLLGETAFADYATAERFYWAQDLPRARVFAMRAREKLSNGSTEWIKARDIIAAAETADIISSARRRR